MINRLHCADETAVQWSNCEHTSGATHPTKTTTATTRLRGPQAVINANQLTYGHSICPSLDVFGERTMVRRRPLCDIYRILINSEQPSCCLQRRYNHEYSTTNRCWQLSEV